MSFACPLYSQYMSSRQAIKPVCQSLLPEDLPFDLVDPIAEAVSTDPRCRDLATLKMEDAGEHLRLRRGLLREVLLHIGLERARHRQVRRHPHRLHQRDPRV